MPPTHQHDDTSTCVIWWSRIPILGKLKSTNASYSWSRHQHMLNCLVLDSRIYFSSEHFKFFITFPDDNDASIQWFFFRATKLYISHKWLWWHHMPDFLDLDDQISLHIYLWDNWNLSISRTWWYQHIQDCLHPNEQNFLSLSLSLSLSHTFYFGLMNILI